MKTNSINFGKHILFGSLIILGGLFSYLVVVRSLGYLPYSHAPGPGWYDDYPIKWEEVLFFGKFILFLGIYWLGALILLFGIFNYFARLRYNQKLYSFLGATVFACSASLLTMITGRYIALDLSTCLAATVFGSFYGTMLFPNYIKPTTSSD